MKIELFWRWKLQSPTFFNYPNIRSHSILNDFTSTKVWNLRLYSQTGLIHRTLCEYKYLLYYSYTTILNLWQTTRTTLEEWLWSVYIITTLTNYTHVVPIPNRHYHTSYESVVCEIRVRRYTQDYTHLALLDNLDSNQMLQHKYTQMILCWKRNHTLNIPTHTYITYNVIHTYKSISTDTQIQQHFFDSSFELGRRQIWHHRWLNKDTEDHHS